MMRPIVSVLMPMKNAVDYISEALSSIVDQAGPQFEIVVIDDGSTDGSRSLVENFRDKRIRLIAGPARGISAALNAGLSHIQGEVVMRCDADDRYMPGRLKHQVELLSRHPEFGAVSGPYRTIDPSGRLAAELCMDVSEGDITKLEQEGKSGTHLCSYAIRVEYLRRLNGFREEFVTAEDIDFKLRLSEATRIWFDKKPVYEYRLHDTSITHVQSNSLRKFYEALAWSCHKERVTEQTDCLMRGEVPKPPQDSAGARSAAEHLRDHLLGEAWKSHGKGSWWNALVFGFRAVIAKPGSANTWRNLAALAFKRPR